MKARILRVDGLPIYTTLWSRILYKVIILVLFEVFIGQNSEELGSFFVKGVVLVD